MQEFGDITEFEWDQRNDVKNWTKHGLNQKEIEEAFKGFKIAFPDQKHSGKEPRFCLIGATDALQIIFVVFTPRIKKVHVISARVANPFERELYEKTVKKYSKI